MIKQNQCSVHGPGINGLNFLFYFEKYPFGERFQKIIVSPLHTTEVIVCVWSSTSHDDLCQFCTATRYIWESDTSVSSGLPLSGNLTCGPWNLKIARLVVFNLWNVTARDLGFHSLCLFVIRRHFLFFFGGGIFNAGRLVCAVLFGVFCGYTKYKCETMGDYCGTSFMHLRFTFT